MPKLRDFNTAHAPSFIQLRVAFEAVRGLVSSEPAISADSLGIEDPSYRKIIDFVNMARLAIWLVDGGKKSLAEADKHFLSLFNCQVCDLPTGMADLLIAIKTQRALEAMSTKDTDRKPEDFAKEFLTNGLEALLKARHEGTDLTKADEDLIAGAKSRQEELANQPATEISALREKYPIADLIRNFSTYIKDRLSAATDLGKKLGIALPTSDSPMVEAPVEVEASDDMELDELSQFFEKSTSDLVQSALAGFVTTGDSGVGAGDGAAAGTNGQTETDADAQNNAANNYLTDYKSLEALVAQSTSDYVKNTLDGLTPARYQPTTVPQSTAETMAAASNNHQHANYPQQHNQQYYPYPQQPPQDQQHLQQQQQQQQLQQAAQQPGPPGSNLPPNQTFPSEILYDKARQAALSKTSSHTRREGLHSTRRPWNQEEEKALMAGLDMVKGPHWSQILTLFGPNGTISDILKDRTQVQLKDKARNLKLFFLKTNSEMPYYLQAVTGELKTRAPTQAARKEAEELARLNSEEDQAKLQGIMTLASGLQHPQQNRKAAVPARPGVHSVVTPAQAANAAAQAANQQRQAVSQGSNPVTPGTAASASAGYSTLNGQTAANGRPRPVMQGQTSHNTQSPNSQIPARPPSSLPLPGPRTQNQPIAQATQARPATVPNPALSQRNAHPNHQLPTTQAAQQKSQQAPIQNIQAVSGVQSTGAASNIQQQNPPVTTTATNPSAPAQQAPLPTTAPQASKTIQQPQSQPSNQPVQPNSNSVHTETSNNLQPPSNPNSQDVGTVSNLKEEDDNAAEAALLKGLQTAIQEATTTS